MSHPSVKGSEKGYTPSQRTSAQLEVANLLICWPSVFSDLDDKLYDWILETTGTDPITVTSPCGSA